MTRNEAKAIIENYKPCNGFFDLSEKPDSLNEIEYAKILNVQLFVIEQNDQREYLRKFNTTQYDRVREIAAELQMLILSHWGDKVFDY